MPDQKEFRKNKRQRGAHPGNLNAFKHGFYSKLFEPLDREDIENLLSMNLECIFSKIARRLVDFLTYVSEISMPT